MTRYPKGALPAATHEQFKRALWADTYLGDVGKTRAEVHLDYMVDADGWPTPFTPNRWGAHYNERQNFMIAIYEPIELGLGPEDYGRSATAVHDQILIWNRVVRIAPGIDIRFQQFNAPGDDKRYAKQFQRDEFVQEEKDYRRRMKCHIAAKHREFARMMRGAPRAMAVT